MLEAEKWTRGQRRIFITYDQLLNDWEGVLRHAEQTLGLSWPKDIGAVREEIENFVSPSLRHHVVGDQVIDLSANVTRDTLDLVDRIYLALRKAAEGKEIAWPNELTSVYDQFEQIIVREATHYGERTTVDPLLEEVRKQARGSRLL
jgi:hypothetical protein